MVSPKDPSSRRYQSWTKRTDEFGLPGKTGYFKGAQWRDLEAGAVSAGFTTTKKVKGKPTEVPDVISYIMHLHKQKGAPS